MNFRSEFLALKKDIKELIIHFVDKYLDSNHAKFYENPALIEQGGRTAFARSAFLEKNQPALSCLNPVRAWGSSKITLGKIPYSLVRKGENHLPLFLLGFEKLKLFVRKKDIFFLFRFNTLFPIRWRLQRTEITCSVACRCWTVFFSPAVVHFFIPFAMQSASAKLVQKRILSTQLVGV